MAKSQMQRNREHVARIRRKAQAYDFIVHKLAVVSDAERLGFMAHIDVTPLLPSIMAEAKQLAGEVQE